MKALLAHHRPKDIESQEKWEAYWNAQSYTLDPLRAAIEDLCKGLMEVKEEDFGTVNHYAQLAFNAGQDRMAKQIIALLPVPRNK